MQILSFWDTDSQPIETRNQFTLSLPGYLLLPSAVPSFLPCLQHIPGNLFLKSNQVFSTCPLSSSSLLSSALDSPVSTLFISFTLMILLYHFRSIVLRSHQAINACTLLVVVLVLVILHVSDVLSSTTASDNWHLLVWPCFMFRSSFIETNIHTSYCIIFRQDISQERW